LENFFEKLNKVNRYRERMREVNIWEFRSRVNIRVKEEFLVTVRSKLYEKYKKRDGIYLALQKKNNLPSSTFYNFLKESHCRKFFVPLEIWIQICNLLEIDLLELQNNISAYKTSNGPNFVSEPILPVKITPIFDMIIAHNIADGTVINPKKGRLPYFGYRQFDKQIRSLYVTKLESIFGKINFPRRYYLTTTRPYCPPVLASLFFNEYNLDTTSFLSRTARIPKGIIEKDRDHLIAVLIAFIIDEAWIDSTMIGISVKNTGLAGDLYQICLKLGYKTTFTVKGEYGTISILRNGMKKFFQDYKKIIKIYPEMNLGNKEIKIENSFKIYDRRIYKTKGNKNIILNMLKKEPLTVNQIALRINMTRPGIRFHIHNLEKAGLISRRLIDHKRMESIYEFE